MHETKRIPFILKENIMEYLAYIPCRTKKEAYEFSVVMHKIGIKWNNGEPFMRNRNHWENYGERTLYIFTASQRLMYGWMTANKGKLLTLEGIKNCNSISELFNYINLL